jgi:2-iminobutanoate/2-iminopropanoate deaminase
MTDSPEPIMTEVLPPELPTYPEGLYSRAVKVPFGPRSMIFTAGHLARDPSTHEIVSKEDVAVQTQVILDHLSLTMKAAGGSLKSIVSLRIYYRDVALLGEIIRIRKQYFTTPPYPAVTGILCELALPDALVEMDAVAVV